MGKIHNEKKTNFGIERKISKGIARLVITFNIILGIVGVVSGYLATTAATQKVMEETAHIAAEMVSESLKEYIAIAYETGSIARLADPDRAVADKKEIIEQRVSDHGLMAGMVLNERGIDIFTGTSYSQNKFFTEAMNGNTYVSTPTYDEQTGEIVFLVSAPLWEGGIPHTKVIGAIVYAPYGEALNDLMRSIKVGEGGSAYMVDSTGLTIADIDSSLVARENLIEEGKKDKTLAAIGEITEKMAAGEKGIGICTYYGAVELISYYPIEGTEGWSVGVCAQQNEFIGTFFITLIVTIILVVIFTVIGVYMGSRTGKSIAKPIGLCVDRLNLLAEGDLTTETPVVQTNDETEVLLKAMGDTISTLNEIVRDISSNLEEISNGNLTVDVSKDYNGNFSSIGDSFREIVSVLSATMLEIDNNADRVSKGSDDMAEAAQCLAEGANEQTYSIQQLTETVEDISAKIQQNAQQAGEMRNIVGEMDHDIQQSNHHMQNMTAAMERIAETSNQIANIMRTIEEIASQTNLLSLNAAIEAARAGDAGRGFAIVADEVRTLAEQTATSAGETAELIQNALSAVEEGTALTKITAQSLAQVVGRANEVGGAIDTIAEASARQAESAELITEGVTRMAAVVEANSATAQESAASSEELSAQAATLKALLEKFKFN